MLGGGQRLWDELAEPFGVKPILCGVTGARMAGWFQKEIKKPDDLKGLKIGVTSPGSSTHFMAAYMLVRNGLKADDASFLGTGTPSTAVAAARREPAVHCCN